MKKLTFFFLLTIGFINTNVAQSIEIDTAEVRTQLEEVQEKMMDMMGIFMNDSLMFFTDSAFVQKYEQLGEGEKIESFEDMGDYMQQITKFLFEDMQQLKERFEDSPLFREEQEKVKPESKKTKQI